MTFEGQIQHWLDLGGPVVGILIIMSITATAVVLLKIYQFIREGTSVPETVHHAVATFRDQPMGDARGMIQQKKGVAAKIVALTIQAASRPSLDVTIAREEVTRLAADHLASLRRHFRTLEVIASLAPLLGLFGTVLGMIKAFRELEAAGSQVDPSILSGGIWEALLTTAVGLAVAIPSVAALNLLEQRVDSFAHQLDSLISRLFTSATVAPYYASTHNHATRSDHADVRPIPVAGS